MDDADVKNLPDHQTVGRLAVINPEFNLLLGSILAKWPNADLFETIKYLTPRPDEPREVVGARKQQALPPSGDPEKATADAWATPYRGETVTLLKTAIQDMNVRRNNWGYANFVPIVQSSGTGKSRVVDELAKQIFTIPLNLHPSWDKTVFPTGDNGLLDLLNVRYTPADRVHVLYKIFFKHLFSEVEQVLRELPSQNSQGELALAFHSQLPTRVVQYSH
ncbi:hypothetical protein CTheo_6486 [Ceratobasidium theobromae]|uniref:Uncharacterized protein n=1 Tax=Ceratobasidium theobromae TaxID=1582974 RepID=A0A5N5QEG7_9AGAM|nr:hypothetical protein CTheo_6486 [Ceratobasidium theobromae]